ncbi:hypothetical protein COCC4DRAFT_33809, partial [Bipolaris maydis ATCC 48331]
MSGSANFPGACTHIHTPSLSNMESPVGFGVASKGGWQTRLGFWHQAVVRADVGRKKI